MKDFDSLRNLKPNEIITGKFVERTGCFENDSVKIKNVRSYVGDDGDLDSQIDRMSETIVNSSRNKTQFEFRFDGINTIYNSDEQILWKHI